MFRFFSDQKIRTRIISCLFLPILALIVLSSFALLNEQKAVNNSLKIEALAILAPNLSNLVHELQQERDTAASYTNNKGKQFESELKSQWKKTDALLTNYETNMQAFNVSAYGEAFIKKVDNIEKSLNELNRVRKESLSLSIKRNDLISFYRRLITRLLTTVEVMAVLSDDAPITRTIAAYTSFLQAKERASRERESGANGFKSGTFSPALYRSFVQMIASQSAYLNDAGKFASPAEFEYFNKTISGPVIKEVNRMRSVAFKSLISNTVGDVTEVQWFEKSTARIELLKLMEDRFVSDLIELADTTRSDQETRFAIILVTLLVLLTLTVIIVLFTVRGIVGPISELTGVMRKLASGDHTVEITGTDKKKFEISEMSRAVSIFKENALRNTELELGEAENRKRREERTHSIENLIGSFDTTINQTLADLAGLSNNLATSAKTMSATASSATEDTSAAEVSTENAANNVDTMAGAAQELVSSINEISNQVSQAKQTALETVDAAKESTATLRGLSDSAQNIGEVIKLIQEIAEQTNLLALNATIEAARAGEAGKGFSVVANEVKNLANQTAKATEEISTQVTDIQNTTEAAVQTNESVAQQIDQISEVSTAIAAAVEEQSAATSEITRNAQLAAQGTSDVSGNIKRVKSSTDDTGIAAGSVLELSGVLQAKADDLRGDVSQFLDGVRSA
ncbi:methyl-accepting chemotaxis protein [Kiloniella sp.]|uniref:methyl-accepting chemotaxis protein n=1 Tax=Kiloniella sp. TaxID=1938587 RepID=UPI003B01F9AB